ncbi:MAG: putative lipid II flippase FtsW [Clostridia bacterium]|nr:putative lipid II flippase FtsW [Clostridia bacterium]
MAQQFPKRTHAKVRSEYTYQKSGNIFQRLRGNQGEVHYPFLLAVGLLLAFGLVMLFSAGSARAFVNFGDSMWYFKNQLKGVLIGSVAMYGLSVFDYHRLAKWAFHILLVSAGLLVLVIIPGVGTTINGATRWLFGFQPSEIAKFAIILFFSVSLSKNQEKLTDFKQGFLPYLIVLGVFVLLLAMEPHFSCIVLIGLTGFLLLFIAGAKVKHFVIIAIPVLIGVVLMIALEPYRLKRVVAFLDPFSDMQGAGYQIVQSLYAIGSGGIFGVGLGQSRQKYQSLPEPQNDFIFSVLAEELGLFGALILIGLFIFLIAEGIKVATKAPDLFGTLLVCGIVGIVAFQALINIAVVTSSIPVTGMPLPFFSFGSTALSITMAEMGIVLNVSRQAKGLL